MSRGDDGGGGGGGGGSSSCTSVSIGKYIGRAFRGGRKKRVKERTETRVWQRSAMAGDGCVSSSVELMSSSSAAASLSSLSSAAVVRVVLCGGVVEVYAGVVLACTVIRRHPPGLCLAHPDVFRNPHGAMVRPLEPLFPGQKFFLLPETTIQKLQRDIPEGSVGAFSDDDDEEAAASSWSSTDTETSWSSEEWETAAGAAPAGCCARDYFVDRERWAEWQFKRMVSRGLAVEAGPSSSSSSSRGTAEPADVAAKKRRRTKRKELQLATAPPPRKRTWVPSLPSVKEEEPAPPSSPDQSPHSIRNSSRS